MMKPFLETTPDEFEKVWRANASFFLCAQEAAKGMVSAGRERSSRSAPPPPCAAERTSGLRLLEGAVRSLRSPWRAARSQGSMWLTS
jgi:hypothetical protein